MDELERLIVNGDPHAIEEYAIEAQDAIAVDWREEEDAVVECVNEELPNDILESDWVDEDGVTDLRISFNGHSEMAGLTLSPVDRCLVLWALNKILKGHYELRAFSSSVGTSDTLSVCVRPTSWWSKMDALYPHTTETAFTKFREGVDLFSVADADEAASTPEQSWQAAAAASHK